MLDLQKAFDMVDHVILGKNLKAMSVKSVDFFYFISFEQESHKEVFWALFFFFVM